MKYFTAVLLMGCTVQALAHANLNGDIRLVGGVSSSVGRLVVYYDGYWGAICHDGVQPTTVQVICRILGFSDSRPTRFQPRILGPVSEEILLDWLLCMGNESRILQCKHAAFGHVGCDYTEQLALDCYGLDIGSTVELRNGTSTDGILVTGNNHGEIGTVCARHWRHANSIVACRMLGVDTSRFSSIQLNSTYYGETTETPDSSLLSTELECHGDETNLTQCHHIGISDMFEHAYCHHLGEVAIDCHGSANMEVSLVNGNDTAGEVRVAYRGQSATMCAVDNGRPAKVLCRMLGYGDSEGVLLDTRAVTNGPEMSFYVSSCIGNEKNISQCGMVLHFGEQMCDQALTIACLPQPNIAVRLVDGNAISGMLEVKRNGRWGRICNPDRSVDYRVNAAVVCRMLDLPSKNVVTKFSKAAYKPMNLYSVSCAGDEDNLNQCYLDEEAYNCWGHDVWISCA